MNPTRKAGSMKYLFLIVLVMVIVAATSIVSYEAGMALRPAKVEYVTPSGQPTHP